MAVYFVYLQSCPSHCRSGTDKESIAVLREELETSVSPGKASQRQSIKVSSSFEVVDM